MGCDIHCYIEYRKTSGDGGLRDSWWNFGDQFSPGRNYHLFGLLAGVRGTAGGYRVAEPRGFPEDAAFRTVDGNYRYVRPDDGVTRSDADRWVASRMSHYKGSDDKYVSNPDWHSHTWLTLDEWTTAIAMASKAQDFPVGEEYEAMTAAMTALEMAGNEVRVVLWFDN